MSLLLGCENSVEENLFIIHPETTTMRCRWCRGDNSHFQTGSSCPNLAIHSPEGPNHVSGGVVKPASFSFRHHLSVPVLGRPVVCYGPTA